MNTLGLVKRISMSADSVACISHRAFRRGQVVAITGLRNQFPAFLVRLVPRVAVRKITRRLKQRTLRFMQCIVTAGPTFEPLDEVRRLTNFSTGRLGSELASFLAARGHDATLLIGQQATYRGERHARKVETFTTTANLRDRLEALASRPWTRCFTPRP